jgi:hypothetical protein
MLKYYNILSIIRFAFDMSFNKINDIHFYFLSIIVLIIIPNNICSNCYNLFKFFKNNKKEIYVNIMAKLGNFFKIIQNSF